MPALVGPLQQDTRHWTSWALRAARRASEPFRDGLLFEAVPNVRFFSRDGVIRAPGELLIDATDVDAESYIARVQARLDDEFCHLLVEEPLMADYELWWSVRELVRELLAQRGCPVLPIASELSIGCFSTTPNDLPPADTAFTLIVVLQGVLRLNLSSSQAVISLGPGESLYIPCAYQRREDASNVVALRLWFPAEGRSAMDAVAPVLSSLIHREMGDVSDLPFVPFPVDVPATLPFAEASNALERSARSDELVHRMEVVWAKRASAYGLEPVPPPRPPRTLRADETVQLQEKPIAVSATDKGALAVNGHAFAVTAHPVVLALVAELKRGARRSVADLLSDYGDGVMPLLSKLYRLRALEVVLG